MTFLAADRLWLLLAVAAFGAVYLLLHRRRRSDALRWSSAELLGSSVAATTVGRRRHAVAAALGLSLVVLVVGLARPARAERIPREEAVVVLAVDVSASMSATDVAPSRLDAAKDAAAAFVDGLPAGFQAGLVAFDDRAHVLATPTLDHEAVATSVRTLRLGQGTAAGDGLEAALGMIGEAVDAPATVVLLSDGATTVGTPVRRAAEDAADAGVAVTTISFGTPTGTVVVQGELVPVPADIETMRDVADATGGTAFEATTAGELEAVYDDIQARVGYATEQRDVARPFLAAGTVALVAAAGAGFLLVGRFL